MARRLMAGLYLFAMTIATPAFSQEEHECDRLPGSVLDEHKLLYESSLIAGFPDTTTDRCDAVEVSHPTIRLVSVNSGRIEAFLRTSGFEEAHPNSGVGTYHDSDGAVYVSCTTDGGNSRARLFVNVSWDGESVFSFRVLVDANHFGLDTFDEQMTFHTLQSTGSKQHEVKTFKPEFVVIENTDSFGKFLTDLAEIVADSCAFDFMASFVGDLRNKNVETLTVAGHSLGGAVTQHVAQHFLNDDSFKLAAYSFSSFGLDSGVEISSQAVFSYYISGDPFVVGLRRKQIGTVLRYDPPLWYELYKGSLHRHYLDEVQSAICKCIEGRGSLSRGPMPN